MTEIYAHSRPGQPEATWETLKDHADAVASLAAQNAAAFGWARAGGLLGQLHDVGKVSSAFQAYIRGLSPGTRCDHSTAGARVAAAQFGSISRALAYAIAGHHSGLADAARLDERLDQSRTVIPSSAGWEQQVGPLPQPAALRPHRPIVKSKHHPCFETSFLIRMLFSALVDADFISTESFYAKADGSAVERGGTPGPAELLRRLRHFTAGRKVDDTPLNALRSAIRDHAVAKAALPPGPFTLTVPTGGGKTLTSLHFALEHAAQHGLRRVIYVIPFTSIIEQTAAVFREVLGQDAVLEHHASFDWEDAGRASEEEGGNPDRERMRRAAENWDAPVVVTTSVQFFESLYASRTSRCRKLHNLAHAVIVLDEAQCLPLRLLAPCLAALDELARNYGCSPVLCTATQPALRRTEDGLSCGLDLPQGRELALDPPALFARLRRQRVDWLPEPVEDAAIAVRFDARPQMLCIVNSRRHAFDLFGRIRGMEGATHLSTYMCPRHRSLRLAEIKLRLVKGLPVRLVATSLVEAGVDFSFPEVWRAEAGLDSVAQAAGRCNREGETLPALGRVVVFRPAGLKPPAELALPAQCGSATASCFDDPLSPEAVRTYFRVLYANRGDAFFDSATLDGSRFPILQSIATAGREGRFDFDSIARAFRMIEDDAPAVIVPWRADPLDGEADALLGKIAAAGPSRQSLRALQRYSVSIPRDLHRTWLAAGMLFPVHQALGNALLRFADDALYDPATGLRVFEPTHRDSATNIF
jgi:CRISPR-associated endonuclease/helicase Cas3